MLGMSETKTKECYLPKVEFSFANSHSMLLSVEGSEALSAVLMNIK
jgi:hypothetical protein